MDEGKGKGKDEVKGKGLEVRAVRTDELLNAGKDLAAIVGCSGG